MTRKEYYEYCFECECNGETPLSFEEVNHNKGGFVYFTTSHIL